MDDAWDQVTFPSAHSLLTALSSNHVLKILPFCAPLTRSYYIFILIYIENYSYFNYVYEVCTRECLHKQYIYLYLFIYKYIYIFIYTYIYILIDI